MNSVPDSPKPLNILCFDGGGVRGLSALLILEKIIQAVQVALRLPEPPRPCEIFDMICGTSTGGLIALMLGRLRMSVKDAIKAYNEFSKDVFTSTRYYPLRLLNSVLGNAMYDATRLERCIKETCREYGGSEDAPLSDLRDGDQAYCRVFVVAVTRVSATSPPRIFRSYPTELSLADQCAIWEAARATTAATLFFDAMEIGDPPEVLIDGGVSGANNPSKIALQEVRAEFPGRPIGCFLSLGTGEGKVVSVSPGFAGITKACIRLLTNCKATADDMTNTFLNEWVNRGQKNPYYRFSVTRGVGNIPLDEWRQKELLVGATNAYLREAEQQPKFMGCVSVLSNAVEDNTLLQLL